MMKVLLTAAALVTAYGSSALALPSTPQAARDVAANVQSGEESAVVTTVQYRRYRHYRYRSGRYLRTRDPDPFVRHYLRIDPPGRQWESGG